MAYMDAAQTAAAKESKLLQDLKFHDTVMEQEKTLYRGVTILGVSPLNNTNSSIAVDFDELKDQKKRHCWHT
eukprot:248151-Ditylum_brightwellii.AAC.1